MKIKMDLRTRLYYLFEQRFAGKWRGKRYVYRNAFARKIWLKPHRFCQY